MTKGSTAADELHRALASEPGQNKRQLARTLNARGISGYGPRDVNRVLYRDDRFTCDGSTPPRWRNAADTETRDTTPRSAGRTGAQVHVVARERSTLPPPVTGRTTRPVTNPPGSRTTYSGPNPRAWQAEVLDRWLRQDRRAIVEAVTGTGKSFVGIIAAWDALSRHEKVLVLVPTADLQDQWFREMRSALPSASIGLRGDGCGHTLEECDVLISIINSAHEVDLLPDGAQGLLIADEVHRYGAAKFSRALRDRFGARLGLTATLERSDEGVTEKLRPYFGPVLPGCDFARGLQDDILARFRVGFVPVEFDRDEQAKYDELTEDIGRLTNLLVSRHGAASTPYSAFMQDVVRMQADFNTDVQASRHASRYLRSVRERRDLLAETDSKLDALERLAPSLEHATNGLVFALTKRGSERAADALQDAGLSADWFHSGLPRTGRRQLLADFRSGIIKVLTAPKVLDEGVDVPAADTAVILAASRGRRQMVQRMGRILRRKDDGRLATFMIVYVAGTNEDPAEGAHETFLENLLDLASDVQMFAVECDPDRIAEWFTGSDGGTPARAVVEQQSSGRRRAPDGEHKIATRELEDLARVALTPAPPSMPSPTRDDDEVDEYAPWTIDDADESDGPTEVLEGVTVPAELTFSEYRQHLPRGLTYELEGSLKSRILAGRSAASWSPPDADSIISDGEQAERELARLLMRTAAATVKPLVDLGVPWEELVAEADEMVAVELRKSTLGEYSDVRKDVARRIRKRLRAVPTPKNGLDEELVDGARDVVPEESAVSAVSFRRSSGRP